MERPASQTPTSVSFVNMMLVLAASAGLGVLVYSL